MTKDYTGPCYGPGARISCSVCGGRWRRGKCAGKCYREAAKKAEQGALDRSGILPGVFAKLFRGWSEENAWREEASLPLVPVTKLTRAQGKFERALRQLWRKTPHEDRQKLGS